MISADPRLRRTLILAAAGALGITAVGWLIGLDWPQALLLGVVVVTCFGFRRLPATSDERWPLRDDEAADRGARREVSRLSWTLQGFESRVERSSVRRLQAVAANRLARRGLDLAAPADAPAVRELVGPAAFRVLTAEPGVRVEFDAFTATVGVVERLAPEAPR